MRALQPDDPPANDDVRRRPSALELAVGLAVLATIVGAAVPFAGRATDSAALLATRAELDRLGTAARERFRATGVVPRSIAEIVASRVGSAPQDPLTLSATDADDAWSRAYSCELAGDRLTISSSGADGVADSGDDARIEVDFEPVRRDVTLEELRAIDRAIALYDGLRGEESPLPAAWEATLARLVEARFLSDVATYRADAWGDAYVAEARGATRLGVVSLALRAERPAAVRNAAAGDGAAGIAAAKGGVRAR